MMGIFLWRYFLSMVMFALLACIVGAVGILAIRLLLGAAISMDVSDAFNDAAVAVGKVMVEYWWITLMVGGGITYRIAINKLRG